MVKQEIWLILKGSRQKFLHELKRHDCAECHDVIMWLLFFLLNLDASAIIDKLEY